MHNKFTLPIFYPFYQKVGKKGVERKCLKMFVLLGRLKNEEVRREA